MASNQIRFLFFHRNTMDSQGFNRQVFLKTFEASVRKFPQFSQQLLSRDPLRVRV